VPIFEPPCISVYDKILFENLKRKKARSIKILLEIPDTNCLLMRTNATGSADIIIDIYLTNIAASRLTHNNWRHKLGHSYNIKYQVIML